MAIVEWISVNPVSPVCVRSCMARISQVKLVNDIKFLVGVLCVPWWWSSLKACITALNSLMIPGIWSWKKKRIERGSDKDQFTMICMSLVALLRSPPALFLVILWCRGGLSYKPGGRSSPNNMLYSVKFILILRRIRNDHDDNDEFKKHQLSLFFLFFCFSVRQKVAQIMRNCTNGYFIGLTNLSIIIS